MDIKKTLYSILILVGYSLAFWFLFFDLLSWRLLRIPMGLAGSLYPVFFGLPVFGFAIIWQMFVIPRFKHPTAFMRLGLPMILISIALILFCPMEHGGSYFGYVFGELISL